MQSRTRWAPACLTLAGALALAGCGDRTPDAGAALADVDADVVADGAIAGTTADATSVDADALSAVLGSTEIPYPVYPNGSKYRVGGENGLKIVVFQTEDEFATVDDYYRDAASETGMPRLIAMSDYVRYSKSTTDEDPWATYRPGIVIHEFADEAEREAVGAKASARTNIIMSF